MVPEKDEITRKRVLYIGSAVPLDTAEGLEGVQRPLSERYPVDDDCNIEGILSYLSVLPTGLTMQYISDPSRILFFPISSLTLCAAVRCIGTVNAATGERTSQFVSVSSTAAGGPNSKRPAIFTAITRRTEGRKVLECHGFICSSSKDALELVQCTSFADRARKGKAHNGPGAGSSFRTETSTTPRSFQTNTMKSVPGPGSTVGTAAAAAEPPEAEPFVRLVPGQRSSLEAPGQKVAPEFYEPPPERGYFYKTKDSQIKTYTVERVMEGEAERLRAVPPNMAPTLTRGVPGERRPMHAGPMPGAGSMTLPHPQGRTVFPVRSMHPTATLIRPRFFSPPPPMLRPRHMPMGPPHLMARDPYIFHPPPPNVIDAPYNARRRHQRRARSDSSSRGSSASSSPDSPREMNGRRVINGDGGDASSDVSSRPRSPPTDYDKGPRVSRKDQFDRHQRHGREMNGAPGNYGTLPGGHPPPPAHPYDFYVYPPRYPYPGYPPYMMDRARSMPPPARRGKSKDRKKSRKGKKEKKKSNKRVYGVPSDISTDSVGYTSEVGATGEYPRMPRDFRRAENQFKHERAFSKSLAQEFRGGPGENSGNAYSLNEHMAQRGADPEADFNLY